MKTKKMAIRLALRHEGHFWNAYMAQRDTMDNAKLIGSVVIGAVNRDPVLRQDFMDLMKRVMAQAIVEVTGQEPDTWETERPGHS